MNYLLLQTFLLLLASYFLGAFLACLVKRAVLGSRAEISEGDMVPVGIEVPVRPPLVVPPHPVRARVFAPVSPPIAPRAIDPVQPKIDVLRRPEPRPVPKVLDPLRFERALIGPDPNEGIPRQAIVEIRPSVLKPVTGMYVPRPPEPPPPPPVPEVELLPDLPEELRPEDLESPLPPEEVAPQKPERIGGLAARLRDATTAAAAGAVAAAKAAAAASVMMPSVFSSRSSSVESDPAPEPVVEPVIEPELQPAPEFYPASEPEPEPEVVAKTAPPERAYTPPPPQEPPAPLVTVFQPEPVVERRVEPKPEFKASAAQPAIEGGDDFQRIRAIDADLEQKLKAGGVNYFEDIAQWTSADVKRIGQELEIPGRIDREQWVEQAQILAKGGETYYSRNRKSAVKSGAPVTPSANTAGDRQPKSTAAYSAQPSDLSGVDAASQGRSVAEMAAAAAAAIAAASASVTRGLKPIEPISPLSKVDPKISIPAKITDAIRQNEAPAADTVIIATENAQSAVAAEGSQDDLKRIRGIGVLIEKRLNALGISRYEQIANWTSGDIDRVSRSLEFKGRIERENWVEQARILASGGQTEFSRRVDRGEVDTSRDA